MYKKLLLLLPLYFGFGCCTDIKDFYNISEFDVSIVTTDLQALSINTITADSIVLSTAYSVEFVSETRSFSLFMNAAYALTCEDSGQQGMKDKLTAIEVTSDNEFNGILANEPLNEFIVDLETGSSLADFTTEFAALPFSYFGGLNLAIIEKPSQPEHQFTLKMTFESGRTIESQTEKVVWN